MTEPASDKENVSEELKKLGDNLKSMLNAFWDSEERKSATRQLEEGAAEISKAIDKFADDVSSSEASKRLRSEVDDIQKRIQSGEMEERVRQDVIFTLQKVNQELNRFSQRWSGSSSESASENVDQTSDAEGSSEDDSGHVQR